MPLPFDFISSMVLPREKPQPPRESPFSDLPGLVLALQKHSGDIKARKAAQDLQQQQLQAASQNEAARRKQQLDIELMKESGRGSRAESRNRTNAEKLAFEREKFAGERDREDEKLWEILRVAESQGDFATRDAVVEQLKRKGYSVGDDEPESIPEENPYSASPARGAPPSEPTPAQTPTESSPTTEELSEYTKNPKQYKPPENTLSTETRSVPSEATPQGAVGTNLDGVPKAVEQGMDELAAAMNGGAKKTGAPPKPLPGDIMGESMKQIEKSGDDVKALDKEVSADKKRKGLVIRKGDKEVYRSPEGVDEFQKTKVQDTFKSLFETAGDPYEQEAAKIGLDVAMGNLGAMKLEDAIKSGMDAYEFQTSRRYRKDRVGTVHGGPKGGPALNKKALDMMGGANDDMRQLWNTFQSTNNYRQMESAEHASILAQDLSSQPHGMANAAALGQLIKAAEGGRPTDADREQYLRGQGALDRLKRKFNELTKTGRDDLAMTPEMLADINDVARMSQSAANNKRRRLGDEWDRLTGGMESIKKRYGDDKVWESDRKAFGRALTQGAESSGGNKPAPAQTDAQRGADLVNEIMRKRRGGR